MTRSTPRTTGSLVALRGVGRALAIVGLLFAATVVHAKDGDSKLSDDLKSVTTSLVKSTKGTWLNTAGAVTYAKVVIVANSGDPDLVDLRRAVVGMGGSVFYRYLSINGLLGK